MFPRLVALVPSETRGRSKERKGDDGDVGDGGDDGDDGDDSDDSDDGDEGGDSDNFCIILTLTGESSGFFI